MRKPATNGSERPLTAAETGDATGHRRVARNETGPGHPENACIHELFQAQAERSPAAVAVVHGSREVTYGELNRRANRLAHHLRRNGVGPERTVAICLERSPDMVIGLLAVLKAGGAYVPLDPAYPRERLQFTLDDSSSAVVLTQPDLVARLPRTAARVLCLAETFAGADPGDDLDPENRAAPLNLAYLIYTSGSTGRPKGVAITHAGAAAFIHWGGETYRDFLGGVLAATSLCFDLSVFEIFVTLCHGGRVILADTALSLPTLPAREAVTLVNTVPSAIRELLRLDAVPASVQVVNLAGEPLPAELVDRIYQKPHVLQVVDLYGPSEDTTYTTSARREPGGPAVIGRPIAQKEVYLLDPQMRPVPAGDAGEIYIGGAGLARGYFRRPELTAESFVPHPFSPEPGARLYRTGDRARYRTDGNLEFLGRLDHQVKVRGFRIELGEIETVLRDQPDLQEAVVLAREDTVGEKQLVAYLVAKPGKTPRARTLREYLRGRLPAHLVPSALVGLAALPLTPNGKIDRRALPAPDRRNRLPDVEYVPPRSAVERSVATLWSQTLRLEPVGLDDHFFELGGHSLLAVQLLGRLRETFQVELPLARLAEVPTLRGMAALVEELQERGESEPEAALSWPVIQPCPAERDQPFPLTDVQQAYWLGRGGDFELGNVSTHSYRELRIRNLDLERYQAAWRRLIERHEMLRAVVLPDGRQVIRREVPAFQIEVLDLRQSSEPAIAEALDRLRVRMSHQVLPTDRWPLFDIHAVLLPEGWVQLNLSTDALVQDAWSSEIIERELEVFYRDPLAVLPPLELSYRDYVMAEVGLRSSPPYQRALAYWRRRMETLAPAPDLPLRQSPAEMKRPRFVRHHWQLEADLWDQVKASAARRGLTPSGVLFTAFAGVLERWSRNRRFTVNVTMFNRLPLHRQVNEIVGDFTSLILLETELDPQADFEGQTRAVQKRLWEDLDHRYTGGVQVLRELAQAQGAALHAMMPVVFTSTLVHERAAGSSPEPGEAGGLGRVAETRYSVSQTPQVYLDNQVGERAGSLTVDWDVVEELFPSGLIGDLFAAYCRTLTRLAHQEEVWSRPVQEAIGTPADQAKLHASGGVTAAPESRDLLHVLFAEQARVRPEQAAVVAPTRTLSYRELFGGANRVGRALRSRGALPDTLVAIVMEKGWEQAVAALGILNAGAAYLPIDPGIPKERLHRLLAKGGVRWVLTQPGLDRSLAWPGGIERLVVAADDPDSTAAEPLPPIQSPTSLAYVIFTSGSTGEPKGVMIDHRGAINTLLDVNRRFRVTPADRVLGLSSLNFDLSVYDLFGMLAAGATLVLPEPDGQRDPQHWLRLMERHRVTLWNTVPALMEMLVEWVSGAGARLPEDLRLVFLSGDWIPLTLPDRIRELTTRNIEIYSGGGATEASIWSILHPITEIDPGWTSIPYGRAMHRQSVLVLDDRLEPRPIWVPGDLYIGGVGVAQGYWGDEEKTRRSFVVHPQTGERLYRTGDLGRYLPDGNIEFLGREDTQVKVQGHRIELGEIEATLLQHPSVQAGVVATVGDPRGQKRLVAYVVAKASSSVDARALQEHLRERLPDYMVPAEWVALSALPLTANGKIDRKALPLPERREAEEQKRREPPRTPPEAALAGIWEEVLGSGPIGVDDDFFELGGDSLLATQVVSRVKQRLHVDVSIRQVFQAPTVRALGQRLLPDFQKARQQSAPEIRPGPRGSARLPSSGQQRLWFLDQLEPGNPAFNIPSAFRFEGELHLPALEWSIREIVRRHEVLRTAFQARGDTPELVVHPDWAGSLQTTDLSALPPGEREEAVRRLARQETLRPFDLAKGPMVRATVLKLGCAEFVLLLTVHHIASDGWSQEVFHHELSELYRARLEGKPSPLPELPIQYFDFGIWQRERLQGAEVAAQLEYWKAKLAGVPAGLDVPGDHPRPPVQTYRGSSERIHVPQATLEKLERLSQREGVTLFTVLLAAFKVLLHRLTSQTDVVVGTIVANRTRLEVEPLMGLFVNPLALRTDLSGDPKFGELLSRVLETVLEAQAHQDAPFDRLVEELQPDRDLSRTPVFQVLFVLQNEPAHALQMPSVKVTRHPLEVLTCQYDLVCDVQRDAGGLEGRLEFNRDLYDNPTIARFVEHWVTLLEDVGEHSDRRLSELWLLSERQERRLLRDWNSTLADVPHDRCLSELFEEQVRRTPDGLAAVCGEERLSYRELNQKANLLARALVERGVAAEQIVGLLMERELPLLIAMLAVFKAGGAYLPLDPSHPPRRHADVLDESRVRVVLCSRPFLARVQEFLAGLPPEQRPDVMSMEDALAAPAEGSRLENLGKRSVPANLAYVIYTSGSIGKPKGAMVEQRGMVNHLYAKIRDLELAAPDRVAQTASQCFVISVWQSLAALVLGGTVHVLPDEIAHDAGALLKEVDERGLTILEVVPSLLQVMLAEQVPPHPRLASLRRLVSTGEALPPDLCRAWLVRYPQIPVVNAYGSTECSDDIAHQTIHQAPPADVVCTPIGRPVVNLQIYLLDAHLRPVPVGIPGDLYVGGVGVGRGYLHRPDLTAERFLPDPFTDEPGARLYRMGDVARYLPDGRLEYLGRVDHQVKVRGFRVELGEIEAVLKEHPAVQDVVVVARDRARDLGQASGSGGQTTGDLWLVAYIVPGRPSVPRSDEWARYLKSSLPEYMVPAAFVILEAMPLSPNGKIDRKALPPPDAEHAPPSGLPELPRDPDLENWLYVPVWKQAPLPAPHPERPSTCYLLFMENGPVSAALARRLEDGGRTVVRVSPGSKFSGGDGVLTVRPDSPEDHRALMAALRDQGRMPDRIVHLWNLAPLSNAVLRQTGTALQLSYRSLVCLAGALGSLECDRELELTIVASGLQRVLEGERVQPEKAVLLGLGRVMPQETAGLSVRILDVNRPDPRSPQAAQVAEQIALEIESGSSDSPIAYRGRERWVQTYEREPLTPAGSSGSPIGGQGGVYVVVDGPQGLGSRLARHLAHSAHGGIALITSTTLPDPADRAQYLQTHPESDPTCLLIRTVERAEALGLPGVAVRADIGNPAQMSAAIQALQRRFGTIHGIIHAPGPSGGQRLAAESVAPGGGPLDRVVQSLRAVQSALREVPVDFLLLCSPLAALTGGPLQGSSCAAHAFLNAVAEQEGEIGRRTLSIAWDVETDGAGPDCAEAPAPWDDLLARVVGQRGSSRPVLSARHLPTLLERTRGYHGGEDQNLLSGEGTGSTEERLATIWQELLGVRRVTCNDSFFQVGGHSLVAIQLINRVRDAFQIEMPLRTSFEAPTIAELAKRIEQARKTSATSDDNQIRAIPRAGALPLSVTQQDFWEQMRSDGAVSTRRLPLGLGWLARFRGARARTASDLPNFVVWTRLTGTLQRGALERSLQEIGRRHEILRTGFPLVDGGPVQAISPRAEVALRFLDVSRLGDAPRELRVRRLLDEQARLRFDVARGPLWQAQLVALRANEHLLVVTMHPLVGDPRSVDVLLTEMAIGYQSILGGKSPQLPFLAVQYADYSVWQQQRLRGAIGDQQQAHRSRQGEGGLPVLEWPGAPRCNGDPTRRATHPFSLSAELSGALQAFGRRQSHSLFVILVAAFKAWLHRLTGQTDLLVGTPRPNRTPAGTAALIGPFASTAILRTSLAGDPTFHDLLDRVDQAAAGAAARSDASRALREPGGGARIRGGPQVLFALQEDVPEEVRLPDLTLGPATVHAFSPPGELCFRCRVTPGGLEGSLEYAADRLGADRVARGAGEIQALLRAVLSDPDRRLSTWDPRLDRLPNGAGRGEG